MYQILVQSVTKLFDFFVVAILSFFQFTKVKLVDFFWTTTSLAPYLTVLTSKISNIFLLLLSQKNLVVIAPLLVSLFISEPAFT